MICQCCGKEIKGKPYLWDDDPRLPLHKSLTTCGDGQLFVDFMNRNMDFINKKGEPVLIAGK